MLGLAIALADDDVSVDEREVLGEVASVLGLEVDLDKLIAEVRG
jgi:tellurite resistance protein